MLYEHGHGERGHGTQISDLVGNNYRNTPRERGAWHPRHEGPIEGLPKAALASAELGLDPFDKLFGIVGSMGELEQMIRLNPAVDLLLCGDHCAMTPPAKIVADF